VGAGAAACPMVLVVLVVLVADFCAILPALATGGTGLVSGIAGADALLRLPNTVVAGINAGGGDGASGVADAEDDITGSGTGAGAEAGVGGATAGCDCTAGARKNNAGCMICKYR